jgi:hypothetical protein
MIQMSLLALLKQMIWSQVFFRRASSRADKDSREEMGKYKAR